MRTCLITCLLVTFLASALSAADVAHYPPTDGKVEMGAPVLFQAVFAEDSGISGHWIEIDDGSNTYTLSTSTETANGQTVVQGFWDVPQAVIDNGLNAGTTLTVQAGLDLGGSTYLTSEWDCELAAVTYTHGVIELEEPANTDWAEAESVRQPNGTDLRQVIGTAELTTNTTVGLIWQYDTTATYNAGDTITPTVLNPNAATFGLDAITGVTADAQNGDGLVAGVVWGSASSVSEAHLFVFDPDDGANGTFYDVGVIASGSELDALIAADEMPEVAVFEIETGPTSWILSDTVGADATIGADTEPGFRVKAFEWNTSTNTLGTTLDVHALLATKLGVAVDETLSFGASIKVNGGYEIAGSVYDDTSGQEVPFQIDDDDKSVDTASEISLDTAKASIGGIDLAWAQGVGTPYIMGFDANDGEFSSLATYGASTAGIPVPFGVNGYVYESSYEGAGSGGNMLIATRLVDDWSVLGLSGVADLNAGFTGFDSFEPLDYLVSPIAKEELFGVSDPPQGRFVEPGGIWNDSGDGRWITATYNTDQGNKLCLLVPTSTSGIGDMGQGDGWEEPSYDVTVTYPVASTVVPQGQVMAVTGLPVTTGGVTATGFDVGVTGVGGYDNTWNNIPLDGGVAKYSWLAGNPGSYTLTLTTHFDNGESAVDSVTFTVVSKSSYPYQAIDLAWDDFSEPEASAIIEHAGEHWIVGELENTSGESVPVFWNVSPGEIITEVTEISMSAIDPAAVYGWASDVTIIDNKPAITGLVSKPGSIGGREDLIVFVYHIGASTEYYTFSVGTNLDTNDDEPFDPLFMSDGSLVYDDMSSGGHKLTRRTGADFSTATDLHAPLASKLGISLNHSVPTAVDGTTIYGIYVDTGDNHLFYTFDPVADTGSAIAGRPTPSFWGDYDDEEFEITGANANGVVMAAEGENYGTDEIQSESWYRALPGSTNTPFTGLGLNPLEMYVSGLNAEGDAIGGSSSGEGGYPAALLFADDPATPLVVEWEVSPQRWWQLGNGSNPGFLTYGMALQDQGSSTWPALVAEGAFGDFDDVGLFLLIPHSGLGPNAVTIDSGPTAIDLSADPNGTYSVSASDPDSAVANVYIAVDGELMAVDDDGGDGWTPTVDFSDFDNGTYDVTAIATDATGNLLESSPLSVTVTGGSALAIAYPSSGASLPTNHGFPVMVEILALPGTPDELELKLDGSQVNTINTGLTVGAVLDFNLELSSTGSHTIEAILHYDSYSATETTTITVTGATPDYAYDAIRLDPQSGFTASEGSLARLLSGNEIWTVGGSEASASAATFWVLANGQTSAATYAIDMAPAATLAGVTLDKGSWASDVMELDGEPTLLVLGGHDNGDSTEDVWLFAYRPGADLVSNSDDTWKLISHYVDDAPSDNYHDSDPRFLSDGGIILTSYASDVHNVLHVPFSGSFTWGAPANLHTTKISALGGSKDHSFHFDVRGMDITGGYGDETGVTLWYLAGPSGTVADLGNTPTTSWQAGVEADPNGEIDDMAAVADVSGTKTFLLTKEGQTDTEEYIASWVQAGTGGTPSAQAGLSSSGNVVSFEDINAEGDLLGATSLKPQDFWRATIKLSGGPGPQDLNMMVSPSNWSALNPSDPNRFVGVFSSEHLSDRADTATSVPVVLASGAYNDTNDDWNDRAFLLIPGDLPTINTDPRIGSTASPSSHETTYAESDTEDPAAPISWTLHATDDEDDDATLSWSVTDAPDNGSLSTPTSGTGSSFAFSYTPTANYAGDDAIVVTVTDDDGAVATTTVTVTMTPVNDPPVATDDSINVVQDGPAVAFTVLASDVDGPSLTYTVTTSPFKGTIGSDDGDADFTYTPIAGQSGGETFVVTVSDGNLSDTATISVTIAPANVAPVVTVTGNISGLAEGAGSQAIGSITVTDADAATDPIVVTISATDANAVLAASNSGSAVVANSGTNSLTITGPQADIDTVLDGLSYTPDADYFGTETITVGADDLGNNGVGGAQTDSDSFTITLDPTNDAPSFSKGADVTINEDNDGNGAYSVSGWATAMSTGNSYESGQTLSFTVTSTTPSLFDGAITVDPSSGDLVFTLAADANGGPDTVTVEINDNDGTGNNTSSDTFTITITAVNDAPSFDALSDPPAIDEDDGAQSIASFVTGLSPGGGSDESGQTVVFTLTTSNDALFSALPAIDGSGTLAYTVNADQSGDVDVTVQANDQQGANNIFEDTFTISVTAVNDPPTLTLAKTAAEAALTEDDLAAKSFAGFIAASGPGGGGDESGQTVTLSVTGNTNPSLFASAPTINGNALEFTLAAEQNGSADLTIAADDGQGANNTTTDTVTITVNAVNDAPYNTVLPVITPGAGVGQDATVTAGTWSDDIDLAPGTISYSYQWYSNSVASGTGTPVGTDSGTYTLTGSDSFVRAEVTAADDGEGSPGTQSTMVSSAWVRAINQAPVVSITGAPLSTDEDTALSVTLTATDADDDANNIVWSIKTNGALGTAVLNGSAIGASVTYDYTPTADLNGGEATLEITATDEGGAETDTAVAITINPINDAPTFTKGSDVTVAEDIGAHTVSGWATAIAKGPSDESGQTLSFDVTFVNGADASLFAAAPAINPTNGDLTFTPADDAFGVAEMQVVLDDQEGANNTSSAQTFTITITASNDAPEIAVTGSASQTIDEDESDGFAPVTLDGTDIDDDNASLAWSISAAPSLGTATLSTTTGSQTVVNYVPNPNASGSDSFTVSVADDDAASTTQVVSVTITPTNDAPVITAPISLAVGEDASAAPIGGGLDVSDVDGAATATNNVIALSINAGTLATSAAGTTTVTGSGTASVQIDDSAGTTWADVRATLKSLTYTPVADATATATLTITASDGLLSPSKTVSITINPVNDAPVLTIGAGSATQTIDEDATPTAFTTATLNGTDVEDTDSSLQWTIISQASLGTATLSAATGASVDVDYAPTANASGSDAFVLAVSDSKGTKTTQAFAVTIDPANDAPTASNVTAQVTTGGTVDVLIPAEDLDDAQAALTAAHQGDASNATSLTDQGGLVVRYVHDGGVSTSDSFTVVVSDDEPTSASAITVTINVVGDGAGNDAPSLIGPAGLTLAEDAAAKVIPGLQVFDPDSGDTVTVTVSKTGPITLSQGPTVSNLATLAVTPDTNASGSASVVLTATDSAGATDTLTIPVTITAVNDAPTMGSVTQPPQVNEDSGVHSELIGTATTGAANETDTLTGVVLSNSNAALFLSPPKLLVAANGAVTLQYASRKDGYGTAAVSFAISDGSLQTAAFTVNIDVAAGNDPPRFTPGPSLVLPSVNGNYTFANWATGIDGGSGESDVVSFAVTPGNAAITAATLDAAGTLVLTVDGSVTAATQSTTVALSIVMSDGSPADDVTKSASVVVDNTGAPQLAVPATATATAWATDTEIDLDEDTVDDTTVPGVAVVTIINGISVADADSPSLTLTITGSTNTVLGTVGGGESGNVVTLTGSPALIQAALDSGVTYKPAEAAFGPDTISLVLNDGDAGTANATASISVSIAVPVDNSLGDSSSATVDTDVDPDAKPVADFSLLAIPVGLSLTLSDLGIDRLVVTWDPSANAGAGDWRVIAPDEELSSSVGYWIEPGPPITFPAIDAVPAQLMERDLAVGWNAFTVAFGPAVADVPWDLDNLEDGTSNPRELQIHVLVDTDGAGSNPEQALTLGEAYAAGYVEHLIWCLDSAGYTPVIPADAGPVGGGPGDPASVSVISAGKSYMFRALTIPAGGTVKLEVIRVL
ncbi:MAG: tandem-95 repeat protein, partial [Planctomycetota bacterium]|nr:tandem-95 repeat protein [Planctomycetota bacterium]